MKKVEEEEDGIDTEGKPTINFISKMVEIEQVEDKALLIPARVDSTPNEIFVINQIVPKIQRREAFNMIKKNFSEYFDGRDIHKVIEEMNKRADAIADLVEETFVAKHSDPDVLPLFDFEINLND